MPIRLLSVRLQPVPAPAAVRFQGHLHGAGVLHLVDDDFLHSFLFVYGDAEVQFVMHLQYHLGFQAFCGEAAVDAGHGHLDNVCRTALYGGIDGVAFGIAADSGVARVDVRQETLAVEDGLHVALRAP